MDIKQLVNNGKNLEIFTASYYQTLDYYVETNLKWIEDKIDGTGKIDIFELDIYGKLFEPCSIFTILSECKRGCNFNDLFLFTGIVRKVNANKNILVCESHQVEEIKAMGNGLDIDVITPEELYNVISGNGLEDLFKIYYNSNYISNALFDKKILKEILHNNGTLTDEEKDAYGLIRKQLSVLIGEVWKTTDLAQKSKLIRDIIDDNKDFVRKIAKKLKIIQGNKNSEFYMQKHPMCQSAAYLMLKYRIEYIVCAVEVAICKSNGDKIDVSKINDKSFLQLVESLGENIKLACKIPYFLQIYVYIFGGVISLSATEFKDMSDISKIPVEDIKTIIGWLKELFTISNNGVQWGFTEDMGILTLNHTPLPLRGLGMVNREFLGKRTNDFAFSKEWIETIMPYDSERMI